MKAKQPGDTQNSFAGANIFSKNLFVGGGYAAIANPDNGRTKEATVLFKILKYI